MLNGDGEFQLFGSVYLGDAASNIWHWVVNVVCRQSRFHGDRFVLVTGRLSASQSTARLADEGGLCGTGCSTSRAIGFLRGSSHKALASSSIEMQHRFDATIIASRENSVSFNCIGGGEMVCDAPRQVHVSHLGGGCQQIHVVACWAATSAIGQVLVIGVGRRKRKVRCAVATDDG